MLENAEIKYSWTGFPEGFFPGPLTKILLFIWLISLLLKQTQFQSKKPDSSSSPLVSRGDRIGHDSSPTRDRFDFQSNPKTGHAITLNRTRIPKTRHVTGGKRQPGLLKFNFLSFILSFERKQLIESEFYVQVKEF